MELQIRPGFNLDCTFKSHLSNIRKVLYNPRTGHFLSADDKTLKAWKLEKDGSHRVIHDVIFPGYQTAFITTMTVSPELNQVFAACLDGNLRIWNEKLKLRSCMPWANGAVREIIYNPKREELITAGSYGVKIWECELDHDAYRTDKDVDPYSIPRTKDGQVILWCYGKYQHARQRLQLR